MVAENDLNGASDRGRRRIGAERRSGCDTQENNIGNVVACFDCFDALNNNYNRDEDEKRK